MKVLYLKLAENTSLNSMIVGLCDTQIGDNPPIVTKKLTKTKTKKSVKKIGRFFFSGKVGRLFCRWGNRLVGHKLKGLAVDNGEEGCKMQPPPCPFPVIKEQFLNLTLSNGWPIKPSNFINISSLAQPFSHTGMHGGTIVYI